MTQSLSAAQARRIALAAQGFGRSRPAGSIDARHLTRVLDHVALHQIDSVNVVARAHYLPMFSRLGPYPISVLERAAWGKPRRLFEYWAHEASLLPLDYHPLLRWRMARADAGVGTWGRLVPFAGERRAEAMALLARIETEGPLAASDAAETKAKYGWWEWSDVKQALEWLFWAGHLTTATRRSSFERVYDLPSRVLPARLLAAPTPAESDAHRALLERSARSLGIATAGDLRDYFRLKPGEAAPRIDELVEAGVLERVEVEGWKQPAYLHRDARFPRYIRGNALLAPFDPLIWERDRTDRLFGMRYRIEIYVPAEQRVHGYYVLPFLMDSRLVARVDLKADRQTGTLRVQSAHAEPAAPAETAARLACELTVMAGWLELGRVAVSGASGLARELDGVIAKG